MAGAVGAGMIRNLAINYGENMFNNREVAHENEGFIPTVTCHGRR